MNANALGAIVFLAAATYLGWTVIRGRAQAFLNAVAGGGGTTGAVPPPPAAHTTIGGPLSGINLGSPNTNPIVDAPTPNVFGDVFGQNGSLNAPQYEGFYGPYSPIESFSPPNPDLGSSAFQGAFGEP